MPITEKTNVRHKTRSNIKGVVLEIADGRAYIELSNGSEQDYALDELENLDDLRAADIADKARLKASFDKANEHFDEI
jgi:hypothetical protein